MRRLLNRSTITLLTLLCIFPVRPGIAADEEPLLVRMYDVAGLLTPMPDRPYQSGLPTSTDTNRAIKSQTPQPTMGGGGGGGMFSVPVETVEGTYHVTQFRSTVDPVGSHSLTAGVQLVDLINQMIQPSSWSDVGHGPGSCEIMGTQLIVRQTQSVHDELAAFLNQLMLKADASAESLLLQAWWIPADPELQDKIDELISEGQFDTAVLNQLAQETDGLHAALRCANHRTSHTTSGVRHNFVRGVVPVVGTDAVGHTSIMDTVNLGILLEARPVAAAAPQSRNADEKSAMREFFLNLRSAVTVPHAQAIAVRKEVRDVDRVTMDAHVFEGLCRVRLNEPTLAGSTSAAAQGAWPDTQEGAVKLLQFVLLSNDR